MGGIEKMNRLTFHLDQVLKHYQSHSHGPINLPEVQRALSRLDGLLSHRADWKKCVKQAEDWEFNQP